ncbi:metal ABC transporter solute-binding protein, Zn/Mn family [Blastococcus sp. SYSU D00695]
MRRRPTVLALTGAAALLLSACGSDDGGPSTSAGDAEACPGEVVDVVVSVGQWGDVVRSLGGDCASVTTVVDSVAVDPHDFEPTTGDVAAFEDADLVVLNGADYDHWAADAAGNVDPAPVVLDLADAVGAESGERAGETGAAVEHAEEDEEEHGHGGVDPHLWYSPELVQQASAAVTAELTELSPDAAGYLAERASAWGEQLAPYRAEVEALRVVAAGRTYAATESVFDRMAGEIGLTDVTPEGYHDAAGNETEPAPGDVAEFESALRGGGVDVLVYNTQTEGGVPERLRSVAEAAGVPVVEVTESVPEDGMSFVDWQLAQLRALSDALARG